MPNYRDEACIKIANKWAKVTDEWSCSDSDIEMYRKELSDTIYLLTDDWSCVHVTLTEYDRSCISEKIRRGKQSEGE